MIVLPEPSIDDDLDLPARDLSQSVNLCRGESFPRYINGYCVRYAQELSRTTLTPVTEVMLESSFSTKSNFISEFVRVVGMTPTEYRTAPA